MLAYAAAADGSWLLGSRRFLTVVASGTPDGSEQSRQVPWERVEDAAWDQEASRLRIIEIGSWGERRPAYDFGVEDPALLLQLVRERVTASIVLQRRVAVRGRLGVTVIGRRSPVGGPVSWMHSYDAGLDPADPEVAAVAAAALVDAQVEVGDGS